MLVLDLKNQIISVFNNAFDRNNMGSHDLFVIKGGETLTYHIALNDNDFKDISLKEFLAIKKGLVSMLVDVESIVETNLKALVEILATEHNIEKHTIKIVIGRETNDNNRLNFLTFCDTKFIKLLGIDEVMGYLERVEA